MQTDNPDDLSNFFISKPFTMVSRLMALLFLSLGATGAMAQGEFLDLVDLKAYIITVEGDTLEVGMGIPEIIVGSEKLTVFVFLDTDSDGEPDVVVPVYIYDAVDMSKTCEKVVMRHYITFKQPVDYRQPLKWLGVTKVQYGTICTPAGFVEYTGN